MLRYRREYVLQWSVLVYAPVAPKLPCFPLIFSISMEIVLNSSKLTGFFFFKLEQILGNFSDNIHVNTSIDNLATES